MHANTQYLNTHTHTHHRYSGPQGWLVRPWYYLFDRDTDELILPLRPESPDMVSTMDLNKKLWKCAEKASAPLLCPSQCQ